MKQIHSCKSCNNFTLKPTCSCSEQTHTIIPLKYIPNDKYAVYRRIVKEKERKEKGFL